MPEGIDWKKIIIRIPEAEVERIPEVLKNITKERENKMRENCLKAYNQFSGENFVSPIRKHYDERIKLYSFYTPSHKEILERYFLPSLKDDYEVILEKHDQKCSHGKFMYDGWIDTMVHKVDLIIKAISENEGKIFIHSDVDVQFFEETKPVILKHMKNQDMVIQKESPSGAICPGFVIIRGSKKMLWLWEDVRNILTEDTNKVHDQDILNGILIFNNKDLRARALRRLNVKRRSLYPNKYGIKWSYLPLSFFSHGTVTGKLWNPGQKIDIPGDIVLHHSNWTIGVENKMALFQYVKDIVNSRKIQNRHLV